MWSSEKKQLLRAMLFAYWSSILLSRIWQVSVIRPQAQTLRTFPYDSIGAGHSIFCTGILAFCIGIIIIWRRYPVRWPVSSCCNCQDKAQLFVQLTCFPRVLANGMLSRGFYIFVRVRTQWWSLYVECTYMYDGNIDEKMTIRRVVWIERNIFWQDCLKCSRKWSQWFWWVDIHLLPSHSSHAQNNRSLSRILICGNKLKASGVLQVEQMLMVAGGFLEVGLTKGKPFEQDELRTIRWDCKSLRI